jgi:hypothetical protein
MIPDALIYLLYWISKGIDLIIPDILFPEAMMSAVSQGMEIVWFFNEVFPIHVVIKLILLFLSIETTLLLVRLVIGFIALIRGAGKPEI